jgi:hypothetical protein
MILCILQNKEDIMGAAGIQTVENPTGTGIENY